MQVQSYILPRTHIVIDDLFTQEIISKMLIEIETLKERFVPGKMLIDGTYKFDEKKKVDNIWLDELYRDNRTKSSILNAFKEQFWSDKMRDLLKNHEQALYETLLYTAIDATMISTYSNGDYYLEHTDIGEGLFITVMLMLCKEPKKFKGGDFILHHNDKKKVIEYKNNRVIIFPSKTLHGVMPVELKSTNFMDQRFTIQYWARNK